VVIHVGSASVRLSCGKGRLFALLTTVAGLACLAPVLAPVEASAQAYLMGWERNAPPHASRQQARQPSAAMVTGSVSTVPPGSYGGGFIEMLMTGRDPTPYVRPGQIAPQVERQTPAVARRGAAVDPMTGDPALPASSPRQRQAALGGMGQEGRAIERVLDPRFLKQEVAYDGRHPPGTIIIDTPQKFLFLVLPNGRALRYGIGVGRPGFEWAGVKSVTRKAEWPDWRPPAAMLKRRPDLPRFMEGGPDNPMGARALYLGSSLYRIHGTNEPHTIGQAVSSGCIRMTNDDVTDLYERVRVGARVIVI
jgi:lipoprotein-anchoring transpeptidase ErfK/SrfK